MAELFKGMSKDKFVDDLVEKTGLNGHELYDYLMANIKKPEPKVAETESFYPTVDEITFRGTRKEARQYIIDRGATDIQQGLFGASSYEFAAAQMARIAKARKFYWEFPVRVVNPKMKTDRMMTYVAYAFWNDEKQQYDFGEYQKNPQELWAKT